jgi:AraC-like DNA-binding protein
MIEVDYLLTTSTHFLENMADGLSAGYGKKVQIENNGLVFPRGLAKGKFEYYPINPGLSVCLIDCVFCEAVQFVRKSLKLNFFHALSFNLSSISFMVNKEDSSGITLGNSWERKILYNTSEKGLSWVAPAGGHIRMVTIYFTREWLLQHYRIEEIGLPFMKELQADLPIQVSLDLDLEFLTVLQNMLIAPAPEYMSVLYYQGCAKRLIALAADRFTRPVKNEAKLRYEEVMELISLKKDVENTSPDEPLPDWENLPDRYSKGKAKFTELFKAVYGKNYSDFVQSVKMQKAAELLREGRKITDVMRYVGFSNQSHFTKVFREIFMTTPKLYQTNVQKNKD